MLMEMFVGMQLNIHPPDTDKHLKNKLNSLYSLRNSVLKIPEKYILYTYFYVTLSSLKMTW